MLKKEKLIKGHKLNQNDLNLEGPDVIGKIPPDEMTSKDYYFDSYAHFGIHEVSHY